jgi:hypothetical protein
MTPSFVSAPPSNEFGANSKSSLKRTRQFGSSLELELLARWRSLSERNTYSSGRRSNGSN